MTSIGHRQTSTLSPNHPPLISFHGLFEVLIANSSVNDFIGLDQEGKLKSLNCFGGLMVDLAPLWEYSSKVA